MQIDFLYRSLYNISEHHTTISLFWRELGPSFYKNTDYFPTLDCEIYKTFGAQFQRMYLFGSYFLFLCQRSELILSCQVCMLYSQHNASFFPKEVSRSVTFLQFSELLLEISAFRTSPGWGKKWEDNLFRHFQAPNKPYF